MKLKNTENYGLQRFLSLISSRIESLDFISLQGTTRFFLERKDNKVLIQLEKFVYKQHDYKEKNVNNMKKKSLRRSAEKKANFSICNFYHGAQASYTPYKKLYGSNDGKCNKVSRYHST